MEHASESKTGPATESGLSRRSLFQSIAGIGIGTATFHRAVASLTQEAGEITPEMVSQAEWIAGINLDEEERKSVAKSIAGHLRSSLRIRQHPVDADIGPVQVFRPDALYSIIDREQAGDNAVDSPFTPGTVHGSRNGIDVLWSNQLPSTETPSLQELPFASLQTQAQLLSSGKMSSIELTSLYLDRLKRYDAKLRCVITLLEEHALELARQSDERRSSGRIRSILDGIPWVAKDIIAIPPWKTTWGAAPFKDQVRPQIATVAERLTEAGAVVMAKVSVGALAWGDKWFDGMTRNPWNVDQGSSGSSAGSASAVAAGLASFALGSETLGSIVSPCTRCRTSGLRPTFGRVSRYGCMPLAWSMDKIGPIARHVADLAYVFGAILGEDVHDPTTVHRSFQWPIKKRPSEITLGCQRERLNRHESLVLESLMDRGIKVKELSIDSDIPVDDMTFILGVEASTVFEQAFRSDRKADYGMWPDTFRKSTFVTAIQYLQANRMRRQLILETERKLRQVDAILGGDDLALTNLSGHPSIVVSCGSQPVAGHPAPGVVKLTAAAYQESILLHLGQLIQTALPPTPMGPECCL